MDQRLRDAYWGGRLVEDTRLQLAIIMSGSYSEQFYINMCRIAKYKVYLGYRTLTGKDCKLKGIKDFIYSRHYGLGILDMNLFMIAIVKQSVNDDSKQQFAAKFLDWLYREDQSFSPDPEIHEYRRILKYIDSLPENRDMEKGKNTKSYALLKTFYHMHPEMLCEIGPGRKYKSIAAAATAVGILMNPGVRTLKLPKLPTKEELQSFAAGIYKTIGPLRSKALIVEMIEYYKQLHPEEIANDKIVKPT